MLESKTKESITTKDRLPKKGIIILTGPSSCGKGAVSDVLGKTLEIPSENRLSMGQVLRDTYSRANTDQEYADMLEAKYSISTTQRVLSCVDTTPKLTDKVSSNASELQAMMDEKYPHREESERNWEMASQLDWLEFCTTRGFLIPDRWTQELIASYLDENATSSNGLFLLDGYPRTTNAAEHLLSNLHAIGLPVLKVLHLSISKQEMLKRAGLRGRIDDTPGALKERFDFYTNQIQPSVDFLKEQLGASKISLIDAHQPYYGHDGVFDLEESVANVAFDCLTALGVSRNLSSHLIESYVGNNGDKQESTGPNLR